VLNPETQTRKVQIINENIENPNRTVFSDIIIKAFGKQGGLMAVLASINPLIGCSSARNRNYIYCRVFTQPGSSLAC
jgi:hypothetical protein